MTVSHYQRHHHLTEDKEEEAWWQCPDDGIQGQRGTWGFFGPFRAASAACGGSQARGRIRAVAAGLHHSHSNSGSEPSLRLTPQLTATPDP